MDKEVKKILWAELVYFCVFLLWIFIFSNKASTMEIGNFLIDNPAVTVAFATAIATICYAFISYGTLREMRKQRDAMYQPEVVIENGYMKFQVDSLKNIDGTPIYNFNYIDGQGLDAPNPNNIYIRLLNIGAGNSQHVKVELDVDVSSLEETIERINLNLRLNGISEIEFKFKQNTYSFMCRLPYITENVSSRFREETSRLSYILPLNMSKDIKYIEIPDICSKFLRLYFNLIYYEYLQYNSDLWQPIFKFNMKLTYQDMGKKFINKFYNLTLFNQGVTSSGRLLFLGSELNH